MNALLNEIYEDTSGQDIIEYIFIASILSVSAIALLPGVASCVSAYWTTLSTDLT